MNLFGKITFATLIALLLMPLALLFLFTGCSTQTIPATATTAASTTTTLAVPSSTVTGGITLLTAAGVSVALDFGIKQDSTRQRIGGYIYTDASLTLQLAGGVALSPADYQTYLLANGIKGDAQYTQFVPTAVSLYKTLIYPKIKGNANAAAVSAYLTAFAQGLQNGAAVYAPSTVLTSTVPVTLNLRVESSLIYVSPLMRLHTDLRIVGN